VVKAWASPLPNNLRQILQIWLQRHSALKDKWIRKYNTRKSHIASHNNHCNKPITGPRSFERSLKKKKALSPNNRRSLSFRHTMITELRIANHHRTTTLVPFRLVESLPHRREGVHSGVKITSPTATKLHASGGQFQVRQSDCAAGLGHRVIFERVSHDKYRGAT
jgi:hypothetical protein